MVKLEKDNSIKITPLNLGSIIVPIIGVTELIVHNWDEKAIKMMDDKQQGKKTIKAKEAKNPEEDYEASKYKSVEGWEGVPVGNFKAAMVSVCGNDKGFAKTQAKMAFWIYGDGEDNTGRALVKINGQARMRRDMVRVGKTKGAGVADIRWRAAYPKWSANLKIEYDADILNDNMIVNLVNRAGLLSGICEHRPSSPMSASGTYGTFRVGSEP